MIANERDLHAWVKKAEVLDAEERDFDEQLLQNPCFRSSAFLYLK